MKTGSVDLPLHPGKCPAWLFQRMKPLAREISLIIIDDFGTIELLLRLADPTFFQALGCVLGFDWHSSGLSTTTCGALKEALGPDTGVCVAGGKGKTSRKAPDEIERDSGVFGLDAERMKRASYLSAKVDSSCVQDGYALYHHCFFFDEKGNWTVVQQGMNPANKYARRYHWFAGCQHPVPSFVDEPPESIAGIPEPETLNLVSKISEETRKASLDIIKDNPNHLRKYLDGQTILCDGDCAFTLPARHEILNCDLTKKDWEMLHQAYELQPKDYEELVSLQGMGGKKLRALALISKLIYGTQLDWKDPVKYSFAHGGKDGIPYPVDRGAYENSISFLRDVLMESKNNEKERALRTIARIVPIKC